MTDGFPVGGGDAHPPELSPATFTRCRHVIAHLIDDDIPGAWQPMMYATIDHWLGYALNGDLTLLLGDKAPWDELRDIRNNHKDDVGKLQGVAQSLAPHYDSGDGDVVVGHLDSMAKRLGNYLDVDTGDGEQSHGPYFTEVGEALKAAYAVQAAYKKDLYQLAKAYRDGIHGFGGGGVTQAAGMLLSSLVKVGVKAATDLIGVKDISWQVFGNNLLKGGAGLVFNDQGMKMLPFGDNTPEGLNWALRNGIDDAVKAYGTALGQVITHMDNIWRGIDSEIRSIHPLRVVPKTDTSHVQSFAMRNYFPAG